MVLRGGTAGAMCSVLLLVVPRVGSADSLQEVLAVLLQCKEAYYRLEDYRGVLRQEIGEGGIGGERQEQIEVLFRKPGYLLLRWQSGLYKGTILRGEVGGTQSQLRLRLGEGFEYIVAWMPMTETGEPFVPGLKDMNEWLTALFHLAQRPATDRSLRLVEVYTQTPTLAEGTVLLVVPAFLIPFRDNTVAKYEFVIERGTGIPMELILRGAGGEIRQRLTYTEIQVNVGIGPSAFEWKVFDSDERVDGEGTQIDLRGFTQSWQRRYGEIEDYAGTWGYEERDSNGELQRSDIRFKFRKPFDLYLHWETGPLQGQEALYRRGWNDGRVRVRTSWYGVPLIGDLAPESYLARWDGYPKVTEFGMNRMVERLQERLVRGWLRGELVTHFLGVEVCDERPCYVLAFTFPDEQIREYGSSRIVTYWDVAGRLPVGYETFDAAKRLIERQTFRHLQVNIALSDMDFDAANSAYGFLVFRHTPALDRFITGRN